MNAAKRGDAPKMPGLPAPPPTDTSTEENSGSNGDVRPPPAISELERRSTGLSREERMRGESTKVAVKPRTRTPAVPQENVADEPLDVLDTSKQKRTAVFGMRLRVRHHTWITGFRKALNVKFGVPPGVIDEILITYISEHHSEIQSIVASYENPDQQVDVNRYLD